MKRFLIKASDGKPSLTMTLVVIETYIFVMICICAVFDMAIASNKIFSDLFTYTYGCTVGAYIARDLAVKLKKK